MGKRHEETRKSALRLYHHGSAAITLIVRGAPVVTNRRSVTAEMSCPRRRMRANGGARGRLDPPPGAQTSGLVFIGEVTVISAAGKAPTSNACIGEKGSSRENGGGAHETPQRGAASPPIAHGAHLRPRQRRALRPSRRAAILGAKTSTRASQKSSPACVVLVLRLSMYRQREASRRGGIAINRLVSIINCAIRTNQARCCPEIVGAAARSAARLARRRRGLFLSASAVRQPRREIARAALRAARATSSNR